MTIKRMDNVLIVVDDLEAANHHMELRFPPVLVGDKQVDVPPIQLREKVRLPVPVPLFLRIGH